MGLTWFGCSVVGCSVVGRSVVGRSVGDPNELNDGFGLKTWFEEGIEANNKRLRMLRGNQIVNLHDVFSGLWVGSDEKSALVKYLLYKI